MPIYLIIDTESNDEHEVFMSYDGLKLYLEEHPSLKQKICAPAIVSGIAGITHKIDSGFGDVLQRVAAANPHSPLADQHGSKGIRESKTRDVVKKHKIKQAGG